MTAHRFLHKIQFSIPSKFLTTPAHQFLNEYLELEHEESKLRIRRDL